MVKWEQKLSVGVKEIDDQHKQFIGIMNRMDDAINHRDLENKLDTLLEELVAYADLHFNTEEKYFDQFNYEGAREHKEEHGKLRNKIAEFLEKRSESGVDVYDFYFELLEFLADWLVDHLQSMDMKYVPCFKEHGLN